MATEPPWKPGDLVQINPEHDVRFGGCVLLVEEAKSWGVRGFVTVPDSPQASFVYYRLAWEHGSLIGRAEWVPTEIATHGD